MTPVLLHGHGLALWISVIWSLSGEDNGITILWHNGIHFVDNSEQPLSTCGANGGFLLLEHSIFTKGSAEVQSYRKLQGGSFFRALSGLNWVSSYDKFLAMHSIHVFFPVAWTDQTDLGVCADSLYIQMGELNCGKHCNLLRPCYGKRRNEAIYCEFI